MSKNLPYYLMAALILAGAIWHSNAQAEEGDCKSIYGLAESMMTARQKGIPAHKAMDIAGDNKLFRKMVIDAYETSRYTTKEYQGRKIGEFANKWYMGCIAAEE